MDHHPSHHHLGTLVVALSRCDVQGDAKWDVLPSGARPGDPQLRLRGQIDRILTLPLDKVAGRVFYVGDPPFDLRDWVEAVSRRLTGHGVRYIPTWMVRFLALTGDALKLVGMRFPITSGRFRSMTTDYITPMDATISVLGHAPWSMEDGVAETVKWYDTRSASAVAPALKDVRIHRIERRP